MTMYQARRETTDYGNYNVSIPHHVQNAQNLSESLAVPNTFNVPGRNKPNRLPNGTQKRNFPSGDVNQPSMLRGE